MYNETVYASNAFWDFVCDRTNADSDIVALARAMVENTEIPERLAVDWKYIKRENDRMKDRAERKRNASAECMRKKRQGKNNVNNVNMINNVNNDNMINKVNNVNMINMINKVNNDNGINGVNMECSHQTNKQTNNSVNVHARNFEPSKAYDGAIFCAGEKELVELAQEITDDHNEKGAYSFRRMANLDTQLFRDCLSSICHRRRAGELQGVNIAAVFTSEFNNKIKETK